MYRILYEKGTKKDLDKIPNADVEKIWKAIDGLAVDPMPFGHKKLSGKWGLYRIRQGDYRIVYRIVHKERTLAIVYIGRRDKAYRDL